MLSQCSSRVTDEQLSGGDPRLCPRPLDFVLFFQVPIIPVVFSSYSTFYLRKEKQFKSGTLIDANEWSWCDTSASGPSSS